jgi:hypothetical protein
MVSNWRVWLAPWLGLLIGVMVVFGATATQSDAATLLKGSFRGNAYATFANAEAGPVATQLGRSAFQPCPCQGTNGKTLSNTVDSVQAGENGEVLKANVTLSTVFTDKTANSARVKNTSKVVGLNALDGLIKAKAIKAVANTSATSSSIKSSPKGSEFVNLVIAGQEIEADVAPNTEVPLDGIGHVLLKSVKKGGNGERLSTITVEMLTIVVEEENEFGLPVGSRIVVAHAFSGFARNEPEVIVGGKLTGPRRSSPPMRSRTASARRLSYTLVVRVPTARPAPTTSTPWTSPAYSPQGLARPRRSVGPPHLAPWQRRRPPWKT